MIRIAILSTLLAALVCQSQAAYTDHFGALENELATRAASLTNSPDKAQQKLGKVCVKALATLAKSTTFSGDLKAAGKVGKSLAKAFPDEFLAPTLTGIVLPDLSDYFASALTGLAGDIDDALTALQTAINGLPPGNPKDSAQAAYDAAVAALEAAYTPYIQGDYAAAIKLLATALKNQLKGAGIVAKASGGGGSGSCGTITTSTITMTVQSAAWITTMNPPTSFAGGEYLVSTGFFNVGGTAADGSALGLNVDTGVNGTGTYTLSTNSTYTVGSPPTQTFTVTSGSITITGLDTVNWTACGTATFTATDGTTTITVSDVQFSIKDLGHE